MKDFLISLMNEIIFKYIFIAIIASVITWIAKKSYDRKKLSIFRIVGKFKAMKGSGAQGFYSEYSPEENRKVWIYVKTKFNYLGMSSATILDELVSFMNSENGKRIKYKFLLMNPKNKAIIEKQEAFKKGFDDLTKLNSTEKTELINEVHIAEERIKLAVNKLKNTDCFRRGNVHIKYFDETIPWWIYIFDSNKIFAGLLEFGKDGRKSPLIVLEKKEKKTTLFDSFENNWNRIWQNSNDA